MSEPGWTAQYYDAVEYYFWGPDKLNSVRKPGGSVHVDVVLDRLKRLEEPLNHLVTLFLDLAPHQLRRELAEKCAGLDLGTASKVADRSALAVFDGLNVTQADVLVSGPSGLLAIEVKLASQSRLTQVLKYALLVSRLSAGRPAALTYLTHRPFGRHWKNLQSPEEVKAAALSHLQEIERLGQLPLTDHLRSEIDHALSGLRLTSWQFSDFAAFLTDWCARPINGPGDETLHGLCAGMLRELDARGLAESS